MELVHDCCEQNGPTVPSERCDGFELDENWRISFHLFLQSQLVVRQFGGMEIRGRGMKSRQSMTLLSKLWSSYKSSKFQHSNSFTTQTLFWNVLDVYNLLFVSEKGASLLPWKLRSPEKFYCLAAVCLQELEDTTWL